MAVKAMSSKKQCIERSREVERVCVCVCACVCVCVCVWSPLCLLKVLEEDAVQRSKRRILSAAVHTREDGVHHTGRGINLPCTHCTFVRHECNQHTDTDTGADKDTRATVPHQWVFGSCESVQSWLRVRQGSRR